MRDGRMKVTACSVRADTLKLYGRQGYDGNICAVEDVLALLWRTYKCFRHIYPLAVRSNQVSARIVAILSLVVEL